MKKTWFTIKASATAADTADISIHDEIGYFGITARDFISELKAVGPVKQINLSIHSPGGEVLDGLAIYNVLNRHPAHITATVEGIAASMASVIAMAADELRMPKNAFLMIHNPWGVAIGDADDMLGTAELLNKMRDTAVNAYENRTGLDRADIIAMMDAETWLNGDEAHMRGFVDTVLDDVAMAAVAFDTRRFIRMPSALSTPRASEDAPAPVEPIAPAADPSPTKNDEPGTSEPASPVEPPAPEPAAEPPGFIARTIARVQAAMTGDHTEEITALRAQITQITAERDAAVSALEPMAARVAQIEQLEAALAASEKERKTASVMAADIAASAGFRETEDTALPAVRDGNTGGLLDQFNAITDAAESNKFFIEHRKELLALIKSKS